jgi:hypothetical protein
LVENKKNKWSDVWAYVRILLLIGIFSAILFWGFGVELLLSIAGGIVILLLSTIIYLFASGALNHC